MREWMFLFYHKVTEAHGTDKKIVLRIVLRKVFLRVLGVLASLRWDVLLTTPKRETIW